MLVLQTLRVFDVLFWPDSDGPMLNVAIMRFRKESYRRPNLPENQQNLKQRMRSMSVFSAALRMCLYVLNHLSPLSYAAVVNLKRLRAIMHATPQMIQFNIPINDWVAVTALNLTLQLFRLRQVLRPLFLAIGFTEIDKISVPTVGPWTDTYDNADKINEAVFSQFESLSQNSTMLNDLYVYFDCSPGRNLIRHMRQALFILAELFYTHNSILASAFEERSFFALGRLSDIVKGRNIINTLRREFPGSIPNSEGRSRGPSTAEGVKTTSNENIETSSQLDMDNASTDGGDEVNNSSRASNTEEQANSNSSNSAGTSMFTPAKVCSNNINIVMLDIFLYFVDNYIRTSFLTLKFVCLGHEAVDAIRDRIIGRDRFS